MMKTIIDEEPALEIRHYREEVHGAILEIL